MTRLWSVAHPNIFFASMHPGWADTPGQQCVCVCVHACIYGVCVCMCVVCVCVCACVVCVCIGVCVCMCVHVYVYEHVLQMWCGVVCEVSDAMVVGSSSPSPLQLCETLCPTSTGECATS